MKNFWQSISRTKKTIFFLVFFLILFLLYREMTMSFNNDPACNIRSDERFLNSYAKTNKYQQANPKNPIYAFVEFDFMYPLEDDAELIVYGDTGNIVPYKGKAKEQIKLVFEKKGDDEYFQSHISVRIYNKKSKAICVYVYGSSIRLPNLKGGNKFLFKMTHPHDEEKQPLSSFSIQHLP